MEKTFTTHNEMQRALAHMVFLQDDILMKLSTDANWRTELPMWIDQYTQAAQHIKNLLDAYQHDEHRQEYAERVQLLIEQQEHILTILQKQRDELATHMRQLEHGKRVIQSYSSGNLYEKQIFLSMDT